jgi:hypothetical protein
MSNQILIPNAKLVYKILILIVVAQFIHAPYEGAGFIHAPYEGAGFIGQCLMNLRNA